MIKLRMSHPDIAERLVDPSLADRYSAGSAVVADWHCPQHPETPFPQEIRRVVAGMGCSYCSGRRVLAGFNDLATTHPELAAELVDPQQGLTLSAGSNAAVQWQCSTDSTHRWQAMVCNRTSAKASGCPHCSGRAITAGRNDLATLHPVLSAELVDLQQAHGMAPRSHTPLMWRCLDDDRHPAYSATPANRTARRPRGCPVCSNRTVVEGVNDLATTHPELAAELMDPDVARRVTFGTGSRLEWSCPRHPEHPHLATPRTRHRTGCGICAGKIVVTGLNDLATTHPELAAELVEPDLARTLVAGSSTRVTWRCSRDPDHLWETFVYGRTGARAGTDCPACFYSQPSRGEDELVELIQALSPSTTIMRSDRTVLNGRELDILLPEHRLAIEFNGVYWHSEDVNPDRGVHQRKAHDAAEAGISLLTIWEDDWAHRRPVITRMIAHKMKATSRLATVLPHEDAAISQTRYARQLELGEATPAEGRLFLEQNHLQGAVGCSRRFVLREHDGTIRALLGLRSPRSNARMSRERGQWEIQRYATRGSIPGGFSRLLRHAERTLQAQGVVLTQWVSFSSRDVSDGSMYRAAGFVPDKELAPDYSYVGQVTGQIRRPKQSFQRRHFRERPDLVWDEGWTEARAARENGLRRIWDCGKTRWVCEVG